MHRTVIVLALALSSAPLLSAQTRFAPVPQTIDMTVADLIDRHGTPDFAAGSLLVYSGSFADLPVDVTFFLPDGRLSEITLAFPTAGLSPDRLRRDADRVLKRLRVLYGPPRSISRRSGEFKTHVWDNSAGEMIHTVIYAAGREEHVIRTIRTGAISY